MRIGNADDQLQDLIPQMGFITCVHLFSMYVRDNSKASTCAKLNVKAYPQDLPEKMI